MTPRWVQPGMGGLVAGMLLVGCTPTQGTSQQASPPHGTSSTLLGQELAQIPNTLPGSTVKYTRSSFGQAWQSTDGSPCRTRDQVLVKELSQITYRQGSRCVVMSGDFVDPYTGTSEHFTKAQASKYPIDHVVPLGWIWSHGAWQWSADQRAQFANDLSVPELQVTTTGPNDAKSDQGPASWLPANRADYCTYATAWVTVLHTWQQRTGEVTIDAADRTALRRLVAGC